MLPVKILKIILRRNCIDYRGCVEKEELQERVKRLWKAREKQKEMGDKIANSGDLGKSRHSPIITIYNRNLYDGTLEIVLIPS